MTQWILEHLGPDVPLHFTAFHPDWKMTDRPHTPRQTLTRSRDIAINNGLRYVYTGNVHDFIGSSTHCFHCGDILVSRDGYELSTWKLALDGRQAICRSCSTPIAGVFESRPGAWGNRQMPIKITG